MPHRVLRDSPTYYYDSPLISPTTPFPQLKIQSSKRIGAENLPKLTLEEAIDWRTKKKENERVRVRNWLRKQPEPELPGYHLLGKVGQRDHVSCHWCCDTIDTPLIVTGLHNR